MEHTIFFSWQTSRSEREGRNLIEYALKAAIKKLSNDTTLEESLRDGVDLDKDTKNVPGNPPIFGTILKKIDRAAIFVPDLTSVAKRDNGELIPNPNVLIEYGWALKSLDYHRIIGVMNTAYGDPRTESLPFDLKHLRRPITYQLSEGASDTERQNVRSTLAKELETALRAVFESEEFKSQMTKLPEPVAFPRQKALDGRARFREKGKPLGTIKDVMRRMLRQPEATELQLGEGAACWFRMMPTIDSGARYLAVDLEAWTSELYIAPILHFGPSIGYVRSSDGGGPYSIEASSNTRAVAYVFKTGEVWMIDSWLQQVGYLELDEAKFSRTLDICATFLSQRLRLEGPYHWEAGFEGISERMLVLPDRYNQNPLGTATDDVVEGGGSYKLGDDSVKALKPFFENIFDNFGVRRSNYYE